MVFSSAIFLFFYMPIFFAAYYALPFRNAVLLIGSLIFYAWGEPRATVVLLVSVVLNYTFGILIARSKEWKKGLLVFGISLNTAILLYYKYLMFLLSSLAPLFVFSGANPIHIEPIVLPIGISFFTFQGISYLIDVYRGDVSPQRNLFLFAMYKAMFPQLIAGPIVRYKQVAGKVHRRSISSLRIRFGIHVFVIGLAQKVLIANTVAITADQIFGLPAISLTTSTAWLGIFCYTLQIYFDFCGYSNMAIGLGHMMGFTYPRNFDRPYTSQSVTEFWRRWHMSLSTWFRDYLYIPLGGNRVTPVRIYFNLLTIFFICGLWHGANWTFVVWGLYHGALLIVERLGLLRWIESWPRILRHAYTLLAVMIGWVFFRADTLEQAWIYIAALFGAAGGDPLLTATDRYLTNSCLAALMCGAAAAVLKPAQGRDALNVITGTGVWRLGRSGATAIGLHASTVALTIFAFLLSALSLASGTYNPFIYFRF